MTKLYYISRKSCCKSRVNGLGIIYVRRTIVLESYLKSGRNLAINLLWFDYKSSKIIIYLSSITTCICETENFLDVTDLLTEELYGEFVLLEEVVEFLFGVRVD